MFGLFKKPAPVEHVYVEDKAPEEEMRTAQFIQQKSQVGTLFANRLSDPNENFQDQLKHYQSVRDDLLGKLDTIEDEWCRNFASHMLINMCMAGNDRAVAKALLAGIRDTSIRGYVHKDFPDL